jgi:hypothetical protein
MTELRPRASQNAITGFGVFVTTASAVLFITFFLADLFGLHADNPYLGIVFFLILPGFFLLGLTLIPVGIVLARRRIRAGLPPSHLAWPTLDLNNPVMRRRLMIVAMLTIANVVIVSLAAFRGVEYMDSPQFCGRVCHTVMEPEYTAYLDGPHSRVHCVDCHIGPGAPWFVKSKLDGLRQVWAVAVNSYERPVPTPVHDLRPARDTCEQCHWPAKFTGDLIKTYRTFASDETNSEDVTTMRLRVGGGSWRFGGPHGIHWHISANHTVEYVAADEDREVIPWVRLTDADGRVTVFTAEGVPAEPQPEGELRTMDCVDCHNRPTHRFAPSVESAVDQALASGALPQNLPYVRREAVRVLEEEFQDRATAEQRIAERLQTFYETGYPDLVRAGDGRIAQAIGGTQRVYAHNVFPAMDVTWGTHPSHIGHSESEGCFRCHDGGHAAPDGSVIRQDCDLCHTME